MGSKWRLLLIPLTIFCLALSMRLYQLPARFPFTADEEYQATYARTIVQDFHPIWIGVSAADTGFYLGPYFTYLTALLLAVARGDPLVTGYFAASLGALTAVLVYFLAKQMISTKGAYLTALLYSVAPLIVYFDQRFWNPSPIPFLVTLLTLALLLLKKNPWWLVVIAFCLGAIWHVHLTLVPLYIIALYVIVHSRKNLTRGPSLAAGALFLCLVFPLVIFDYNHAWSNLLTPIRLLRAPGHTLAIAPHAGKLGETLARFLYLTPGLTNDAEVRNACPGGSTTLPWVFALGAALPLLMFLLSPYSWREPKRQIIAASLALLSIAFVLYPGPISAYYALGLIPLYFLVLTLTLKKTAWLAIIVFALLGINTLMRTDARYGLGVKRQLIADVMAVVQDQAFILTERGTCHTYAGWRFLFLSYGKAPAASSADSSLGWLYPHEIKSEGKYQVEIGASDEFTASATPISVFSEGGYTAYISRIQE